MGQDTIKNGNKLYDFIYIDKNRLYSFISQLNEKGFLIQQIASHSGSDTLSMQKNIHSNKGVKVNAVVAEARLDANDVSIQTQSSTSGINFQDTFNTEHIAPAFLINKLIQSDLVKKKLNSGYGDLIFLSGSISIKDISILQEIYKPLSKYVVDRLKDKTGEFKLNTQDILSIMSNLPHLINFSICTEMGNAWSTLNKDYFLIDYKDFLLKHGLKLAKEWQCLAILDSKPMHIDAQEMLNEVRIDSLEHFYDQLVPITQQAFGMSPETYGITPIAIFRELNKKSKN